MLTITVRCPPRSCWPSSHSRRCASSCWCLPSPRLARSTAAGDSDTEPFGHFAVTPAEFGAQFASKSILDRFRVGEDVDAVSRAIRGSVRMMGRAGFVHSNGAGFLFHARR